MAAQFLADLTKSRKNVKLKKAKQILPAPRQLAGVLSALSYSKNTLQLQLRKKPRKPPVIIEGFPGFGFVATIAVEYIMDHLKLHPVGRLWSPKLPPIAFVHGKRVIQPLEVFHNDKYNLIVLEAVTGVLGLEWELADALVKMYKRLGAREIISIEGIGSPVVRKEPKAYYWTNSAEAKKALEAIGLDPVKEGAIIGVSGALMLRIPQDVKATFIFAETHSELPDSRAAAKIIKVLDSYLGLKIDYKPLLKRAEEFEKRLKAILEQTKRALQTKAAKEQPTPYIG